jgi:aspartyl-tRNA(Asn)/glutamyl-tRNA(Gln) amidotransferase subunit C
MSINVEKVAHLARLSLTNANQSIEQELNAILTLADQMAAVNTDGITPMAHPMEIDQPLRPDHATEKNQRDAFLSLAPKTEAGLYLVPNVLATPHNKPTE